MDLGTGVECLRRLDDVLGVLARISVRITTIRKAPQTMRLPSVEL